MKYLSLSLLIFLVSCSHVELLPGLCYTDKEGSFLCDELEPKKEPIILDPIKEEELDSCDIWKNVDDPDAYMNCIMIA